jgi:kumamolisin
LPAGLSSPLSVDVPGSDPAITAVGGTTTPYTLDVGIFGLTAPAGTPNFSVSREQVWGWDSLQSYLVANFGTSWQGAFYSNGSGGGVSSFWSAPTYQAGFPGQRLTETGQALTYRAPDAGSQILLTLPSGFAGRNVPDVAANADPLSGYSVLSTADGGWNYYYGGTSFGAPQMNGISALLHQRTGGRVGLWNPMLYRFALMARAGVYDITAGDNWFYDGIPGYEPGAGLGILDVAKFASSVASR